MLCDETDRPLMQVSIGTGEAASSADCHLEFSSYGDLSSLTWVANTPVPASLASSLVSVNVAYGKDKIYNLLLLDKSIASLLPTIVAPCGRLRYAEATTYQLMGKAT